MEEFPQIDAYKELEISSHATGEEIRLAYHRKIAEGQEGEKFRFAYELIRDTSAREKYLWHSVHSYFDPPPCNFLDSVDVDAVISEMAFLSDWELGVSHDSE